MRIEENKMYSQRESELLQKYLQAHGEMPAVLRMILMICFNRLTVRQYDIILSGKKLHLILPRSITFRGKPNGCGKRRRDSLSEYVL